jgi:hypothetical protein
MFIMLALLALPTLNSQLSTAHAQGTAFTYQGRLNTNGVPAAGLFDFEFSLYNAASGGGQVGSTITQTAVGVTNGLFTTSLDFGGVFTGNATWLAISVRSNGVGSYAALTPRQDLTPTPYAIYAGTAGNLVGTLPSADFSGTYGNVVNLDNSGNSFAGNGSALSGVNASTVDGLSAANFWQLTGNAGTSPGANYLGTPDNTAFEIKVDNDRALLIQPDPTYAIPSIIGGNVANTVTPGYYGNFIGGGGWTGSDANQILTSYLSVISGGIANTISNAFEATIGGGEFNTADGGYSTVGGGYDNSANGYAATIPGGLGNSAAGEYSFAAGLDAHALNEGSFVWADSTGMGLTDVSTNEFQVRATGGLWFHNGTNGVNVDADGNGYGNLDFGLRFGRPVSGEGIASDRTTANNQYGLDFYTEYAPRMSITQAGPVGINTKTPNGQLDVEGTTGTANGIYVTTPTDGGNAILASATNGPSAYAVWATTTTGLGVVASSDSGTGVSAYSGTGTALYATAGDVTNSALTIGGGAIHVSGAGVGSSTAAFVQVAAAGNIVGATTIISNPLCNGDPNALLFVTHSYNPPGVSGNFHNNVVGVFYNGSNWTVYNEDDSTMAVGASFNVLVIKN